MTRLSLLGAIFALIALTGCNDSALPPGGSYQSLTGVVLDAATHQPVSGAVVTVDTVLQQTTGADGTFSFAKVPVGDVDYAVQAPGYKALSPAPVRLDPDKPLVLTVTLSH